MALDPRALEEKVFNCTFDPATLLPSFWTAAEMARNLGEEIPPERIWGFQLFQQQGRQASAGRRLLRPGGECLPDAEHE
jgi:hypothetical protein